MGVFVCFLALEACGILAPWPAGDWTWLVWTPCPGRQSFNHWTTREVSNPFKENNSEHLVHSQYHATFLCHFRTFPSPLNVTLYTLAGTPISPSPCSWQLPIYFLSLWICLLWIFHIKGTINYVTFCVWLLSLSIMFSRFSHVVVRLSASLLLMCVC